MADLESLENQRLKLEESVASLRKTLHHWRTWDAEYEGLKEDLVALEDDIDYSELVNISQSFGGELVNEREITELLALGTKTPRKPSQVVGLVERRQDYVQKNIQTISKRLGVAEDELLLLDDAEGALGSSEGLPLSEIVEELDDDDNVISSQVNLPETATAHIIDTLRKVGLTDVGPVNDEQGISGPIEVPVPKDGQSTLPGPVRTTDPSSQPLVDRTSVPSSENARSSAEPTLPRQKSVSFAEDVEEFSIPARTTPNLPQTAKPRPSSSLLQGMFGNADRVIELDDDDDIIATTPITADNDTPEEARLRREMLQYSLNEVGSVVAELDLDETYSDDYDEDIDLDDEEATSDLSEDEDEHGRTTKRVVSDKYRMQMLELEEKLQARMIENLGPQPAEDDLDIDPDELRRLVIRTDKDSPVEKDGTAEDNQKKTVRFADSIDVASNSVKVSGTSREGQSLPDAIKEKPLADSVKEQPLAENVMERLPAPSAPSQQDPAVSRKTSRFKKMRTAPPAEGNEIDNSKTPPGTTANADQTVPVDKILLDRVVERAVTAKKGAPPQADELDPELQQRQLASEYYRMRNNVIRQQGGFKASEEETEEPLMEEIDGKVKKVSRFRAARMQH